jgi:hypothetical protein
MFPSEEVMGNGTAQEQLGKLFNADTISQMFAGTPSPSS